VHVGKDVEGAALCVRLGHGAGFGEFPVDIENAGGGFDQRSQLMLTGLPGPLLSEPDQGAGERRAADRKQRDQQINTMAKPDAHEVTSQKIVGLALCGAKFRRIIVGTS
jgi:hypothetical protein